MVAIQQPHTQDVLTRILTQGALVEGCLIRTELATEGKDVRLGTFLVKHRVVIERGAQHIHDECVRLLEGSAPSAADLRGVLPLLRINQELSQIASLSFDIAKHSLSFRDLPWEDPVSLEVGARIAWLRALLRRSMDSLAELNSEASASVHELVVEGDSDNRRTYDELEQAVRSHTARAYQLAALLCASAQIECAAHCVGRIAGHVTYMVCGQVVGTDRPAKRKQKVDWHARLNGAEESAFLMEPAVGAVRALAAFPVG